MKTFDLLEFVVASTAPFSLLPDTPHPEFCSVREGKRQLETVAVNIIFVDELVKLTFNYQVPPLCLPPCRVPPLGARVLGEAHQAGYCSCEARRGWAVHADRGCCELRGFLPQTLWEAQLAHAHGYWDSVEMPAAAWNSPSSPGVLLFGPVTLHAPCFTQENPSPRAADWCAPMLPQETSRGRNTVPHFFLQNLPFPRARSRRPIFSLTLDHRSSLSIKYCERNQVIKERPPGIFPSWLDSYGTREDAVITLAPGALALKSGNTRAPRKCHFLNYSLKNSFFKNARLSIHEINRMK